MEEGQAVMAETGCDDFMRKPFKDNDIFAMMHKHIGVRYVYESQSHPDEAIPERLSPAWLAA